MSATKDQEPYHLGEYIDLMVTRNRRTKVNVEMCKFLDRLRYYS